MKLNEWLVEIVAIGLLRGSWTLWMTMTADERRAWLGQELEKWIEGRSKRIRNFIEAR